MTTARPDNIDAGPHTTDDGLFGTDSVSWRGMAHPSTAIAAATAATIQMLYPPVMYIIDQASSFREKPELRAQRTSEYGTTITYGDVASAEKAAATLRRIHARCHAVHPDTGETINADDEHLLVWVNNALTWSLLRGWQTYGLELSAAERESYYAESRRFSALFGLDERAMPPSYDDFARYNERMWETLRVTTAAREMAGFLLSAAPAFLGPLARWYGAMTAGLLPPPIRKQFGLPFGRREALAFRASLATLRRAYHRFPPALRFVPAYRDACARLRGEPPSTSPVDRLSRRLFAA